MSEIRIVIADDHESIRSGLRRFFESTSDLVVVGEARNGREAVQSVQELHPDILLLDLVMPDLDGFEVLRQLSQNGKGIAVLILTVYDKMDYIKSSLDSDAAGYLTKDEDPAAIVAAIRRVAQGEKRIFSQRVQEQLDLKE